VIGRLEKTVIDRPDPRALAGFYCQVLGMRVSSKLKDTGGWVVIGSGHGPRQLVFQGSPNGFRRAGLTRRIPSAAPRHSRA